MKISIVLLIISFNVISIMKTEEYYGIEAFLEEILSNGFYDILRDIKNEFGPQVAIEVCLLYRETGYCEPVIRIYMPGNRDDDPKGQNNERILTEKQKKENYEKLKKILSSLVPSSLNLSSLNDSSFARTIEYLAYKIAVKFQEIFSIKNNNYYGPYKH